MSDSNEPKVHLEKHYTPTRDRVLFRGIALFMAIMSVLSILAALGLASYDKHDLSLVLIGIGSGLLGSLSAFFTQNITR